jgi:hypothetical protein
MSTEQDDAIVASLMLLFAGRKLAEAEKLLVRALDDNKVKYVCRECGGENISWRSDCYWDNERQRFIVDDWDHCWCSDCDSESRDDCVPIDWVKPAEEDENNPALKPSGDTQVT